MTIATARRSPQDVMADTEHCLSGSLEGRRNRRIDFLRGVSILLVLLHHFNIAYPLPDTPLGTALTPGLVRAVMRNGNYGVTLFFVISGFLITSHALRRWGTLDRVRPGAFYLMRVARIAPCLLLLLAIVAVFSAMDLPFFQSHRPGTLQPVSPMLVYGAALGFWMNVLIEHLGWVNYPLGVLWSLSVEEVFYASFPLVCLVLRRPGWIAAFWAMIILIGPVYRATHQQDEAEFLFAYFASFDGIAIGCLTALLSARIGRRHVPAWCQAVVAILMVTLYLWAPIGQTNTFGVTAMAIGTAALLLGADGWPTRTTGLVDWLANGVELLGHRSYELYLFHLVVLAVSRTWLPARTVTGNDRLLLLATFLAASVLVAYAIGVIIADPLNNAIRRLDPALKPGAARPAS